MCTFFHYDKMWTQVYSFSRSFCKLYHSKFCLYLFIYFAFFFAKLFISFFYLLFSSFIISVPHTHTIHFKQYQRVLEPMDSGIDQIASVRPEKFGSFF
jgi:hypothetical protein